MNVSFLARSIFAVSTCAGLLAGCSGASSVPAGAGSSSSAGIDARGQLPNISVMRTGMVVQHLDRRPSHMENAAKSKALLYVSDVGTGSVQIFDYPNGTNVGTITGFGYPEGLCSDSSGNVYVADGGSGQVFKYAHGGTTPMAILSDSGEVPASCAVDPSTGNLAVANLLSTTQFEIGSISVYPAGSTTPTVYTDSNHAREYFLSYDSASNLYVDGVDSATNAFRFSKMALDGTFSEIKIKGATFTYPGGVQVVGNNIAVGDQDGALTRTPDVYSVSPSGKVVGKTTLATSNGGRISDLTEFTLTPAGKPKQIVAPDALGAAVYLNVWPKGTYGSNISGGLVNPLGTALSAAPKK
jgi:NHL repeat